MRVLDVGCGSGDFCALALARGASASGIDAAPAMIEIARRRAPGADLRVGAMDALPWEDGDVRRGHRLQLPAVRRRPGRRAARVGARARPGGASRSASGARARTARSKSSSPRCAALAGAPEPPARFCERLLRSCAEAGPRALAREHGLGAVRGPRRGAARARAALRRARLRGRGGAARETIVAAAAPFRRGDGSYRFENAFRYVLVAAVEPVVAGGGAVSPAVRQNTADRGSSLLVPALAAGRRRRRRASPPSTTRGGRTAPTRRR